MPEINKVVAQIARDAATSENALFVKLCADMCWTAVVRCAMEAAALNEQKFTGITGKLNGEKIETFKDFISMEDPVIADAASMRRVPQGCFLAFIEEKAGKSKIIHAMVSTGMGLAAGNKNGCIGLGKPLGFEILDLAGGLQWVAGESCFNAVPKGTKATRHVQIRYREIKKVK